MPRKYLLLFISPFIIASANAKSAVDCRVATGTVSECNPYASKFIVAKEITYKKEEPKLIVVKTLPSPQKQKIKVISVIDMIEEYVTIEKPLRYEASTDKSLKRLNIENRDSNRSISLDEEMNIRRAATMERIKKFEEESYTRMVAEQKATIKKYDEFKTLEKDEHTLEKLTIEQLNDKTLNKITQAKIQKIEEKILKEKLIIEPVRGFYEVCSGDSLSRIAHRFYMKTSELMKINDITKGDKLKIGKELTIKLDQDMIDVISKAEYIIESGDHIGSISKEFNITRPDILKYNKLKNSSKIKIGQKLILPFPYKIAQLERERKSRLAELKRDKKIRGNLKRKLRVTATAYSSHGNQTDSTPFLAAWNNRIRPGMKIIAVSRDMLTRYGLKNGSKVRIGGLSGYYTVRDKMNKRYRKRIDIYMGMNRRKALRWGKRSVILYY